jgi:hypothetical protein
MKMNDAIDMKAEVFVQAGVTGSYMFNWMVDVHVERGDSLYSQRHIISALSDICDRVYKNVTRHAHGFEPLTVESANWLSEYWKDIQRLRK